MYSCFFLIAVFLLISILWRKLSYGSLDPIVFGTIGIPLSAILIVYLFIMEQVDIDLLVLFIVSLSGFLLGAIIFLPAFSLTSMRKNSQIIINSFPLKTVFAVVFISIFMSVITSSLAILFDGGGEGRFALQKLFKPIFLVQMGLLPVALVMVARDDFNFKQKLILSFFIVFPNFFSSGKSLILLFVYFWGFDFFVNGKKITLKLLLCLLGVAFVGLVISLFVGFGVSSFSDVFSILLVRMAMFGDVYIYAYQMDLLSEVRGVYSSFPSYVLHPLTSIFGVKGYDLPLGSMLNSALLGYEDIHGPNPQLPVLLDLFFHGQLLIVFILSTLFGILSFFARYLICCKFIIKYKYLGVFVISSCLFIPSLGFFDFSLVLTAYVSYFSCYVLLVFFRVLCSDK